MRVPSFVRSWLSLACALTAVLLWDAVALSADEPQRRPNILWIVGENLKLDLGCYGAKHVRTPNLDGLAAKGMRYTKVFSTSPVCAPSRSAFFVGMYQTTSDTHNMRSHRNDDYRLPEGVRPITHRLKDAGYYTANIKTMGDEVVGSGKLDLNFVNEGPLYDGDRWEDLPERQPFFAQINTLEAEYDIYDRQTWRQPRVEWKGERQHEKIAEPEHVTPPPYYPDRHFTSLNRYKEKCFPIKPLMRELMKAGKLTGPAAELMSPTVAPEQLFDTENDPHEIVNLATSNNPEHREALISMRAALSVWVVETQDLGVFPEPDHVVKPFAKEMHDWFGTPNWHPYTPPKNE